MDRRIAVLAVLLWAGAPSVALGQTSSPCGGLLQPACPNPPTFELSLSPAENPHGLQPLPDHPRLAAQPPALYDRHNGHVRYGFNTGFANRLTTAESVTFHKEVGATIARYTVTWPSVELNAGRTTRSFNWSWLDAIYKANVFEGIRPIFMIYKTPRPYAPLLAQWDGTCPDYWCDAPASNDKMSFVREFARRLAARYPLLAGIEAWNEPNLAHFWKGEAISPTRYTALLRAVDQGVNTPVSSNGYGGRPSIRVLGGALNNTIATDNNSMHFGEFLDGMLDVGAGWHMDALSFHPYPYNTDPEYGWRPGFATLDAVLAQPGVEPASARYVRLVPDEVGLNTGVTYGAGMCVTRQQQRDGMAAYFASLDVPGSGGMGLVTGAERVDAIAFHNEVDGVNASQSHTDGFGFATFRTAGSGPIAVKPVFRWLREDVAGLSSTLPTGFQDTTVPGTCG